MTVLLDLGSWLIHKRAEYLNGDAVHPAQLYGAGLHHLRPLVGELQHLLISDHLQLAGVCDHAGVGGIDAGHIGEDLAAIGAERRCECHGGGI